MEQPQAPHWDINRQLDQPEDEFFGLIDDLPADGSSSPQGSTKKRGILGKILGLLVEQREPKSKGKGFGKNDFQELEELQQFQPTPGTVTGPPDLTSHIQQLGSAQDKLSASFLAAESSSSLFDDIQVAQQKRYRTATWSLWIVAAIFAWLGYRYGQNYLKDLTNADLASETWVVELVGAKIAYMLSVVCGVLAPIGLFWVAVLSLHLFLGGLLELRPARILLGLLTGAGILLLIQLVTIPAMISVVLVSAGIVLATRVCEWILVRLGWY
jgi:hypothetical protein